MNIDNTIKETYCSIEVCKALKEKKFDVFCEATWTEHHVNTEFDKKGAKFEPGGILHGCNSIHESNEYYTIYSAPTQSLAIEWIRKNFYFHIEAHMNIPQSGEHDGCFVWNGIVKDDNAYKVRELYKSENRSSNEKALNDALLHCLTKLIRNK